MAKYQMIDKHLLRQMMYTLRQLLQVIIVLS